MGIRIAKKHQRPVWNCLQPAAKSSEGLTLIETLIAILIISLGLLSAGQMMYVAAASASLSRSKSSAAIAAQNKLESLADLYRRNPAAAELAGGKHGPEQAQVVNSVDGSILNRYNVSWIVAALDDPRPGKVLSAKQVTVTVTPIDSAGNINNRLPLNKAVSVTGVLSVAPQ